MLKKAKAASGFFSSLLKARTTSTEENPQECCEEGPELELEVSFSSGATRIRAADAEEEKRWELGMVKGFLRTKDGILESRRMDVWDKDRDSSSGTSGEKRSELSQLLWFIERTNICIDSVRKEKKSLEF